MARQSCATASSSNWRDGGGGLVRTWRVEVHNTSDRTPAKVVPGLRLACLLSTRVRTWARGLQLWWRLRREL